MPLLWEKQTGDTHYQVKAAGNSIRLYTNGIFHSQWNPKSPIVGQLWELIFLPAFFLDTSKPLRVLLLGVGGGAVVNLLNHYLNIESLTGIELDATHLQIAKRWFKSDAHNVHFVHVDAVVWLKQYKGPKFDLIIDDLFGSSEEGEVLRAVEANEIWYKQLARHLKSEGVLVMNFESIRQASKSWRKFGVSAGFSHAGLCISKRNENAIAVFRRGVLDVKEFKRRLAFYPELNIRRPTCKLDFKFRKLRP